MRRLRLRAAPQRVTGVWRSAVAYKPGARPSVVPRSCIVVLAAGYDPLRKVVTVPARARLIRRHEHLNQILVALDIQQEIFTSDVAAVGDVQPEVELHAALGMEIGVYVGVD